MWSERLVYAVSWAGIFSVPLFTRLYMSADFRLVTTTWLHLLPFVGVFLLNDLLLLPRLLVKGHKTGYVIAVAAVLVAVWFGINPHLPARPVVAGLPRPPFDMFRVTNVVIASCVIFANVAVRMYFISIRKDVQMLRIRNEQMNSELKSLKYQINPHFLMNTLNNIQSLIETDPEKACGSIQELSKMMRYVLLEYSSQLAPLAGEVEFMSNFIRLMRIRYPEWVNISARFPAAGCLGAVVPPLLLITFIENAFKHGVSYKEESSISVEMSLGDGVIQFMCLNTKPAKRPRRSSRGGIGLDNVKRRLDLLYSGRYKLDINDGERYYMVQLEIPMKR